MILNAMNKQCSMALVVTSRGGECKPFGKEKLINVSVTELLIYSC